jgi:hypothetical protein
VRRFSRRHRSCQAMIADRGTEGRTPLGAAAQKDAENSRFSCAPHGVFHGNLTRRGRLQPGFARGPHTTTSLDRSRGRG